MAWRIFGAMPLRKWWLNRFHHFIRNNYLSMPWCQCGFRYSRLVNGAHCNIQHHTFYTDVHHIIPPGISWTSMFQTLCIYPPLACSHYVGTVTPIRHVFVIDIDVTAWHEWFRTLTQPIISVQLPTVQMSIGWNMQCRRWHIMRDSNICQNVRAVFFCYVCNYSSQYLLIYMNSVSFFVSIALLALWQN